MKLSTVATVVITAFAASGAMVASAESVPSGLMRTVAYLEAQYGGEVVAIALDAAGEKPVHHHVDLIYPASSTARLDEDASTVAIANRDDARWTADWATLPEAVALAAAQLPGEVIAAHFDAADAASAHYDIDARPSHGDIVQVKVDPRSRQFGRRNPSVVAR